MRISTLVIRGQEHGDFKVCRARAAICEVDTLIFQVLTLQVIKCWVGPENEARVQAHGAFRTCRTRTHSEHKQSIYACPKLKLHLKAHNPAPAG